MSSVVLVDVETTGLDPQRHEVVEVAWHIEGWGNDDVYELRVPHTLLNADKAALDINGYAQRELWDFSRWALPEEMREFQEALRDNTICSANVGFDTGFLSRLTGPVWHYRVLDFTSWAAGRLGVPTTLGMQGTYAACVSRFGEDILEPDHTAAGDVRSMLSMRKALLHDARTDVALRG